MSSRGKKKSTMAKLNREARLRERRAIKKERKDARKDAAANGIPFGAEADDTPFGPETEEDALAGVAPVGDEAS
jgi:hypothetical protein